MDKSEIYEYRKSHKDCNWCRYNAEGYWCKATKKFIILKLMFHSGKECIFYEPERMQSYD